MMAKSVERVKILPKEVLLKKLEKHGLKWPKEAYITAQHLQMLVDGLEGKNHKTETDQDIDARLRRRFRTMDQLVEMAIKGEARAVIISGAPGLGKSYNVEKRLLEYDPDRNKHSIVRGFSTTVNLYKALYDCRMEGQILVLDDCDAVRKEETGINLLKAATDTLDRRIVSYLSEGTRISEKDNSRIPNSFEFCGTLIFITNEDMDSMAQDDSLLAQHMMALMSRGHYCDLTLRTRREAIIRIRQVLDQVLVGCSEKEVAELMKYVEKHREHFRDLSIRTVMKISQFQKTHPTEWEAMATDTLIPM